MQPIDCAKKEKKQLKKNKAVLSLIRLALTASSYAYLWSPVLHTMHNVSCQTNPEHMYNIGLPLSQTTYTDILQV